MSINIQGGEAKGFSLALPDPNSSRPTSALLKRRFFDSHQDLSGHCFYDICAGSGSIGLEALSRGARKVVFVELAASNFKVLKKNVQSIENSFELEGHVETLKMDCLKWIKSFSAEEERVIIFFDPPYENQKLYKSFVKEAKEKLSAMSNKKALFVLEFCRQKTGAEKMVQEWIGKPDKFYRQGTSFLYVYDFS